MFLVGFGVENAFFRGSLAADFFRPCRVLFSPMKCLPSRTNSRQFFPAAVRGCRKTTGISRRKLRILVRSMFRATFRPFKTQAGEGLARRLGEFAAWHVTNWPVFYNPAKFDGLELRFPALRAHSDGHAAPEKCLRASVLGYVAKFVFGSIFPKRCPRSATVWSRSTSPTSLPLRCSRCRR